MSSDLENKNKMIKNWKIEDLGEGLKIYVSKEHTFGTDAFLLANFAKPKISDVSCDFGTGCGIIPLVWQTKTPPLVCYAIDIQKQAIQQLNKTVSENNLGDKIIPVLMDINDINKDNNHQNIINLTKDRFSLITCNPPYKELNSGILSTTESDKIARHETMCTMDDICRASSRLLKFGGRLCICQRPQRLIDSIISMRKFGLEPKNLRFVQDKNDKAPWLFLLEAKKGAKSFLKIDRPFILKNDDGFTDELLCVYGRYKTK